MCIRWGADIIDSVLDMNYSAARITYDSAVRLLDAIRTQGLSQEWIIETHVFADHLFGVRYLQEKLGGVKLGTSKCLKSKVGIGRNEILMT